MVQPNHWEQQPNRGGQGNRVKANRARGQRAVRRERGNSNRTASIRVTVGTNGYNGVACVATTVARRRRCVRPTVIRVL